MHRILDFSEFALNESLTPGGWPSDWKSMPEWATLQDLGFVDATTPLQARNETIMLKNERIPIYPAGVVLQKSGYIRNKGVTSGFIKNLKEKPYSLKMMFDYLIKVYSDWVSTRVRSEKHGELSDELISFIASCTKTKNWEWNPLTRSVDVRGSVTIPLNPVSADGTYLLNTFKFGKVKGNFYCNNIREIQNLRFCPDFVGEEFSCSKTSIRNLVGSPKEIKGTFSAWGCDQLNSLEGLSENIGAGLFLREFVTPDVSIDSFLKVFEGYTCQMGTRGNEWVEIKDQYKEKARMLVTPMLSNEKLDSYFTENPMDLYKLDEFPAVKKGVLQRTGIKDLSAIGRNLKHGLI